jgi:predicted dehydrogenase
MVGGMPKDDVVLFGIIGTGRIANDFADDLRHVPNARLHAILSRNIASAEKFKQRHDAAEAYDSIDEFLADEALDIVYIASPNSAHVGQSLKCIRAGKAVLVEKPLAPSEPEAEVIFREAQKHDVLVMEGMWIRFLPGILKAKELIQSGAIGDIKRVRGELSYKNQYDPASRMFDKSLGGGACLDLGVYLLSLCIFLFGEPKKISGAWHAAPSGVDSSARFHLIYQPFGPNLITFEADFSTGINTDGGNVFEVEGTEGVLRIESPFIQGKTVRVLRGKAAKHGLLRPPLNRTMTKLEKIAARLPLPGQETYRFDYRGHGLQFEAAAMAQAVRSGDASGLVSSADSAAVLHAIGLILSRPPLHDELES